MNGKVAKRLRRQVTDCNETSYAPLNVVKGHIKTPRKMDHFCGRAKYQNLKKDYKAKGSL